MNTPTLRLLSRQRVAESNQIAPLQYTIKDTARMLAVSPSTIDRLIKRGELASIGNGKLRRVAYDSIVAYMDRYRNQVSS